MDVVIYLSMFVLGYLICYLVNPREGESFKVESLPSDVLDDGDIIKVKAITSEGVYMCELVNSLDKVVVFYAHGGWGLEVGKIYKFIKTSHTQFNFKLLT